MILNGGLLMEPAFDRLARRLTQRHQPLLAAFPEYPDQLLGQEQVVIKTLEANYRKVSFVAGATILGEGRVVLILDVASLVRSTRQQAPLPT